MAGAFNMANKPAPRNWNDVQIAIATVSMVFTLAFWNLFAGPDREVAAKRAQEQASQPPPQPANVTDPVQPAVQSTTLQGNGPILLGGSAPQTNVVVQTGGGGGGGSGGGGGGGSTGTS
jgi:hypothetical protein